MRADPDPAYGNDRRNDADEHDQHRPAPEDQGYRHERGRNGGRMARGKAHMRIVERNRAEREDPVLLEQDRPRPPDHPLDDVDDDPGESDREEEEADELPDFDPRRCHTSVGPAPVGEEEGDTENAGRDEQPVGFAEARRDLKEIAFETRQPLPPGDGVLVDRQEEEHYERARDRRPAQHQPPARISRRSRPARAPDGAAAGIQQGCGRWRSAPLLSELRSNRLRRWSRGVLAVTEPR